VDASYHNGQEDRTRDDEAHNSNDLVASHAHGVKEAVAFLSLLWSRHGSGGKAVADLIDSSDLGTNYEVPVLSL